INFANFVSSWTQEDSEHISIFLRREFSAAASKTAPQQPGGAGSLPPPPPENGGSSAKVFLGSAVVGAGLVGAYKTGSWDWCGGKLVEEEKHDEEKAGNFEEKIETHSDVAHVEGLSGRDGEEHSQVDDNKSESDITSEKLCLSFPKCKSWVII
ncbi:hypothetical protein Prudu_017102, partial [Prunus dulcis]